MTRLAAEIREDRDQEAAMREMNATLQFEIELAKVKSTDYNSDQNYTIVIVCVMNRQ